MPLLRRVFSFQEFDPKAYRDSPDITVIALRFVILAALVVVPVLFVLVRQAIHQAPVIGWLLALVVAFYIPLVFLFRRTSVRVSSDYRITLRNPKSIQICDLLDGITAACAFFLLAGFAVLALGR